MTTQTQVRSTDEALKMALEALDQLTNAADTFSVSGVYFNEEVWAKKCLSDAYFAINAIEQTLAQQSVTCVSNEQVEPVAWMYKCWNTTHLVDKKLDYYFSIDDGETYVKGIPLYTTPPPVTESHKRKPLTDEQMEKKYREEMRSRNWEAYDVWLLKQQKTLSGNKIMEIRKSMEPVVNFIAFARAIEAAHNIKENT